jgi:glycosyltransferase involved in cell wall biosynthesis
VRILQLVSCRGWSSDAYLAAGLTRALTRLGHEVTLGCRAGTETAVMARARAAGTERITAFAFGSGLKPGPDLADLARLRRWLPRIDAVHVHRGKEHWLAAVANRLSATPRPLVRSRHIVQAVRPHAGNRWLYGRATDLVHAVSDAIRGQYLAAGLVEPDRVVTLQGGADAEIYRPDAADPSVRGRLGGEAAAPLVGLVAGLRVMKGHEVVVDALARLGARAPRVVFVGRGPREEAIREAIGRAGLGDRVALLGHLADVAAAVAALDVALYVPLESEGMSRVLFEYLAAERPVIAARVGAVPEVLADREHALLVPAGDAEALSAALAEMLEAPELRARLGRAGRQLVLARHSSARLAAALETHYARLAARPLEVLASR